MENIVDRNNIGYWIKENTKRVNILIDKNMGMFFLNFCEAYLQFYYKPKYEGFYNQIKCWRK